MIHLRPPHLEIVKRILAEQVPDREARVFGSRIKPISKPYSDLDLVIMGTRRLERNQIDELAETFAESDLPFRVDILDWFALSDDFRS